MITMSLCLNHAQDKHEFAKTNVCNDPNIYAQKYIPWFSKEMKHLTLVLQHKFYCIYLQIEINKSFGITDRS